MINWFRSWFCSHEFVKHVDEDYTIKVKSTSMTIYPYKIRQSYIFCKNCGKTKKLS